MAISIPHTPLRVPDLLVPNNKVDLSKWAVIACDQFTSNHKYWKEVETLVGNEPSSYHLMIPEIYFTEAELYQKKLHAISTTAHNYVSHKLFDTFENTILVTERILTNSHVRKGIVLQLDLNEYSDKAHIANRVKSTEKIIESRLPKRIECKKASSLDLSHILLIYEDKEHALHSALSQTLEDQIYSIDLMMEGGTLLARSTNTEQAIKIISSFFKEKQTASHEKAMLAVGDGNHSLMSAKKIWEENGSKMDSPERWALVELVNIYDNGLSVEPIHRILYDANFDLLKLKLEHFGDFSTQKLNSKSVLIQYNATESIFWNKKDDSRLSIEIVEDIIQNTPNLFHEIDFIHSKSEIIKICKNSTAHIAICFQEFDRNSIFAMVHSQKFFPRKSFSLGNGEDKKYYVETSLLKNK